MEKNVTSAGRFNQHLQIWIEKQKTEKQSNFQGQRKRSSLLASVFNDDLQHSAIWRRGRLKKESRLDCTTNYNAMHEGIRTIETDQNCEFSDSSDVCISIITWNMNGQVVFEDLKEVVAKRRKFDLLVVGLQEAPRDNISQFLQAALLNTHVLVGNVLMQSLQLYLFARKNSEPFIHELIMDKHSFGGFAGLIRRKKGAVSVRINYKGVTMVFINCHLAAHAHMVEERNSQLRSISRSLFSKKHWRAQLVVWLGDFNYRLQGIDSYPARDMIHNHLHNLLTSKDQLLREAEKGQIFDGYSEGELAFKPTYKYDIGTNEYDTSHKVQFPVSCLLIAVETGKFFFFFK
ncbi:hypothetical protein Dimus_002343 [Dionaea muscipula]